MIKLNPEDEDDQRLAFDCWETFNNSKANWWTCEFLRLVAKSDAIHTERLATSFPREVRMYQEWVASEQSDFAEKWGIPKKRSGL